MSEENVEIVRQVLNAGIDATPRPCFRTLIPRQSFTPRSLDRRGMRTGHEGVRQWMAESDAAFDVQRMEAEEWRDLGDDVLLIGRVHARGRESGVEIDSAIGSEADTAVCYDGEAIEGATQQEVTLMCNSFSAKNEADLQDRGGGLFCGPEIPDIPEDQEFAAGIRPLPD
jgi:hypothetical protein